jgi:hypothetical protein
MEKKYVYSMKYSLVFYSAEKQTNAKIVKEIIKILELK